ncbi:ROK family protein [Enterococcus entomosocium]|uniref:ROK family protein n=1 Tax=Enterococcus entomosocium TaxID=3034352 RepID=UPI003BDE3BF9
MNILALDIGGTYIKYGMYNIETNQLVNQNKILTPQTNQKELINAISEIKSKFHDLSGCAISLPGTIDQKKGFIQQGGSLQYNNHTYFTKNLSQVLKMPVTIENDAKCAALAELWQGNLRGVKNALVLVVGTGLGCAVVQEGRIYRGVHGYAGEFSLIFTKKLEQYGFEALLGPQVGIPRFVEKLSSVYGEKLTGLEAFKLLEERDVKITKYFDEYIDNFVTQIFNFQIMFDPEKILIGGGISQNAFYMSKLNQSLSDFHKKLPLKIPYSPLEKCKFENDSNLLGAVRNFKELM